MKCKLCGEEVPDICPHCKRILEDLIDAFKALKELCKIAKEKWGWK